MIYSSDDTHIKNRNDTRATPRQDNRIEQESTQESTQETSDRYQVRVISNKQIKTPQKHRMKHLKNTEWNTSKNKISLRNPCHTVPGTLWPIAGRTRIVKIGNKSFPLEQDVIDTDTQEVKSERARWQLHPLRLQVIKR